MSRKMRTLAALLVLAIVNPLDFRATSARAAPPPVPDILVVRDGWQAERSTVQKVLESTAGELWRYFPERKLAPIIVHPQGGPITLFRRGPKGEIYVWLNTGSTYWAQYAYQFSHEFGHVLCNCDADDHGNDWFEEAICEMASIFTLRRMGETWKTSPPFEHWKNFAPHLTSYAENLVQPSGLPEGTTLASWYAEHAEELRESATRRDLNRIVAVALLPLFEQTPEHWQSVTYLNHGKPARPQSLTEFLADWHKNSPQKHRAFIEKIAGQFAITIEP